MTYLDDAAHPREHRTAPTPCAPPRARTTTAPLLEPHLELRREKAEAAGLQELRRSGAGRPHGEDRRARAPSSRTCKRKTERASSRRTRSCWSSAEHEGPAAPHWSPGTWPTTPRSSARALYDFDEEAAAPVFSAGARDGGPVRHRRRALRHSRRPEETGAPVWDPAVRDYTMHDRRRRAISAASTPTGSRAKTSAAARGWMRLSPAAPARRLSRTSG